MTEETRRADNLAFEMKKLEEKHETVMKEKEVREPLRRLKLERCFFTGLQDVSSPLSEDHHGEGVSERDERGAQVLSGSAEPALTSRYLTELSVHVFVRNIKAPNMIRPNGKSLLKRGQ